jgi:hypothetical protein
MEYLIGSLATIITVLMSRLFFKKKETRKIRIEVRESQAMMFEIIKDSGVIYELLHPKVNTQATKHHENNLVRIIFVESQAYWIRSNVFYTADLDEMGLVDFDSTRAVDTMTMSKVQLDKMSFIVEKLTEGK